MRILTLIPHTEGTPTFVNVDEVNRVYTSVENGASWCLKFELPSRTENFFLPYSNVYLKNQYYLTESTKRYRSRTYYESSSEGAGYKPIYMPVEFKARKEKLIAEQYLRNLRDASLNLDAVLLLCRQTWSTAEQEYRATRTQEPVEYAELQAEIDAWYYDSYHAHLEEVAANDAEYAAEKLRKQNKEMYGDPPRVRKIKKKHWWNS